MLIAPKPLPLKDGRTAILRSPTAGDAAAVNEFSRICAAETEFLLMEPGDPPVSLEDRAAALERAEKSPHIFALLAVVEGRVAGTCRFTVNPRRKIAHRGGIIIYLAGEFWGLGIGSAMFREMIAAARAMGLTQLELGFVEGNDRARTLYEKMGFTPYGRLPDAFRLLDGSFRDEILMVKKL